MNRIRYIPIIVLLGVYAVAGLAEAQVPSPLNVVQIVSDPARPLAYGLHQDPSNVENSGSVVIYNRLSGAVTSGIPVGKYPTDMAITADGSSLYVLNVVDKSISKIDLATFQVTSTRSLVHFDTYATTSSPKPHGEIAIGPGNVIFYVDAAWGPQLRAIDFVTGAMVGPDDGTGATSPTSSDGFGDIVVSSDKTKLYGWKQYGWSAGSANTYVTEFSISATGLLTHVANGLGVYEPEFQRDPLDSRIMLSADDSRLLTKSRQVATDDLNAYPRIFDNELYSLTPNGALAGAPEGIYDVDTAEKLSAFAGLTAVQCMSADGTHLIYFDDSTAQFATVDLVDEVGFFQTGLTVAPADGSGGATPASLQWFARTGATSYRVYLGTNQAAVEGATGTATGLFQGETSATSLDLSAGLANGVYYWKVDALTAQGTISGEVLSFVVSPVSLPSNSVELDDIVGVQSFTKTISIGSSSGGAAAWTATSGASWLSVTPSGNAPGDLVLTFDFSGLAPGFHEGFFTITSGGVSFDVRVSINVVEVVYQYLRTDLEQPYIWGISQSEPEDGAASLLQLDAATGEVLKSVDAGSAVTDFEIHYPENRIYVTNWASGILRAFDRTTLELVQTYGFNPRQATGSGGGDVYRISAGKAGRLLIEEEDQWIELSILNTVTGEIVADSTGSVREGGGEYESTGRYYYHGDSNSSAAGITRFDTVGDALVAQDPFSIYGVSSYGGRTVIVSANGSRVFWARGAFDREANPLWATSSEILATTRYGKLAFTETKVLDGDTGAELGDLSVSTKVMAVTGDQQKLVLASGSTVTMVDLASFGTLRPSALTPDIEDGGIVIGQQQTLRWTGRPFAAEYKVYLGTSQAAVNSATEASAEFIGTVVDPELVLANLLNFGVNYFWRVDVVDYNGTAQGNTWAFEVAPLSVGEGRLKIEIPVGSMATENVAISPGSSSTWTASVPGAAWMSIGASSGSGSEDLAITVDATSLAAGTYQRTISFSSGGTSFDFPVEVIVFAPNYTFLRADLEDPFVYAVSSQGETSTLPSFLSRLDATTGAHLKTVGIGGSITDVDIHYLDDRIYVTNWMLGKILAFDRASLELEQVYRTTTFVSLYGENDPYRISAGKVGRLIFEGEDQWVDAVIMDTDSGAFLDDTGVREGGGVFGALGRYYFHGDNNSSGAALHRYDTLNDEFVELAELRPAGGNYYGHRTVVGSPDGSRFYWNGAAFDETLGLLWSTASMVEASTYFGDVVFSNGSARSGADGTLLGNLPVATDVLAVSGDQQKLFMASGDTISTVAISEFAEVPSPNMTPTITDGGVIVGPSQTLGWSRSRTASGYRVYFGTSESEVLNGNVSSSVFLGETAVNYFELADSLTLGGEYFWRIDTLKADASVVTGDVWSFEVAPLNIDPRQLSIALPVDTATTATLSLTADSALSWTASVLPAGGAVSLGSSSGSAPGNIDVSIDATGLVPGTSSYEIAFQAGGMSFSVPVEVEAIALNFTHLEADFGRPFLYGISQQSESSFAPAFLVRIDEFTGTIVKTVPAGSAVTDLVIHYHENRLYLTNWMLGKIRAFDRDTLAEVQTYDVTPFGGVSTDGDAYRIAAGSLGRLYVQENDQWIDVSLISTSDGSEIAKVGVRQGGGGSDPSGRYFYQGESNSSGAELRKFDTDGNAFTDLAGVRTVGVNYYGTRDALVSPAGNVIFWNGTAHDQNLNVLWTQNESIITTVDDGSLAFSSGDARNGTTGESMGALPIETTVMAVGGRHENLFLADGGTITTVDLSAFGVVPGGSIRPLIEDDSVIIGTQQTLTWTPSPFAISYDVYFGSNETDILNADRSSSQFLGNIPGTDFVIPDALTLGGEYFWRIDPVGSSETTTGSTWSFEVAPLQITPAAVLVQLPVGTTTLKTVQLTAPATTAWTATVPAGAPFSINKASGTTADVLELAFDAQGISAGTFETGVDFQVGSTAFRLPVTIEVLTLNYTLLKADLFEPYIYGISQSSESTTLPAHLLRIDSTSGQVLDTVPVGASVSDLEIHYPENRIYVTNWKTGKLRAFDRTTLQEVQVYDYVPFGSIGSSDGDAYRISAGANGRLIVEENDQWIDVDLINTVDGSLLATTFEREGDGAFGPAGRYYYHGDNNTSGAELHKIDTDGDAFSELTAVRTTGVSYYGSRVVRVSRDGSRIFWNGSAHDDQLNVLWTINSELYDSSSGNSLVFGFDKIYAGSNGSELGSLPVANAIKAVSYDDKYLFMADGSELTVLDLGLHLIDAPLNLTATDGTELDRVALTWSDDGQSSGTYLVYRDTIDDPSGAVEIGEVTDNSFADVTAEPGRTYYYWVSRKVWNLVGAKSATSSGYRGIRAPQNLIAEANGNSVVLTWDLDPAVVQYRIYRAAVDFSGSASWVGTVSGEDSFTNNPPSYAIYHYFVLAQAYGRVSEFSPSVAGGREFEAPATITASSYDFDKIEIDWSETAGASSYTIFRSLTPSISGAAQIASLTSRHYTDSAVSPGVAMYYFIQARNAASNRTALSPAIQGMRRGGASHSAETPGSAAAAVQKEALSTNEGLSGSFYGLIKPPGDVDSVVGRVSARASKQSLSLSIAVDGASIRTKCPVDESGRVEKEVSTSDGRTFQIALQLMQSSETQGLNFDGTISENGSVLGDVFSYSNRFHARKNPAPFSGSYTLLLPHDPASTDASIPGGEGHGVGAVATNGKFRFSANLADGQKATMAGYASDDGELSFYTPLYPRSPAGWIAGTLRAREVENISDLDGMLHWRRPAGKPRPALYVGGFDVTLPAIGSRYERPASGERMISSLADQLTNAMWSLQGGDLSSEPSNQFLTWNAKNKILFDDSNADFKLRIRANSRSGLVTGSYEKKDRSQKIKFSAVVFQKQNFATGYFPGENGQSGVVTIEPTGKPELLITDSTDTSIVSGTVFGFANTGVDGAGSTRLLNIENTGDGTLEIQGFPSISANTEGAYRVVTAPAGYLAPGQSTVMRVSFAPTSEQSFSSTLVIRTNDRDANPFTLNLTGQGEAGSAGSDDTGVPHESIETTDSDTAPDTALAGAFDPATNPGTYFGVVSHEEEIYSVVLSVRSDATFSGSITLGRSRLALRGQVDPDTGEFAITRASGPLASSIRIENLALASLVSDAGVAFVSGEIVDVSSPGGTTAFLIGNTTWPRSDPPATVGSYTLAIPCPEELGASFPSGDCVGLMTVAKSGAVRMTVFLADGSVQTCASRLDHYGSVDFVKLWRTGRIAGGFHFTETAGISDLHGTCDWRRDPDSRAKNFKAGFVLLDLDLVGSSFERPASGVRVLSSIGDTTSNAVLSLAGDQFEPTPDDLSITWTASNSLAAAPGTSASVRLRASASSRNGLVRGTYYNSPPAPAARQTIRFTGVVFQKQQIVTGSALQGVETGHFMVVPE